MEVGHPDETYPVTIPTTYALRILAGTAGATHTADSQQSSDFLGGQPLWLSFFYKATRVSGSGLLTLSARVRWWNAAGTELTATFLNISIDATVGLTFSEYMHTAPATAVKCAVQFLLTPAVTPIQHTVEITKFRLGRTQVAADVSGEITGPALMELAASDAGVLQGVSPYATGQFKLFAAGTQLMSGVTWAHDAPAGVTLTLTGTGTGFLSVTGMTVNEVDVTLSATAVGRATKRFKTTIKKNIAPPPVSSGSGGGATTASQTSGFGTIASGTAAAMSDELTMTTSSSGNVDLSVNLADGVSADGAPGGTWYVRAQWYRWNGASYVAVGSTMDFSVAEEVFVNNPPGEDDENYTNDGSVSNAQSYAGMASSTEKFKLYAWILGTSTSTTRTIYFSGQISATG